MKCKKSLLSLLMILLLAVSGCAGGSTPANVNSAFEDFTLQIFKEDVASNTLNLHYTLKEPKAYGITTNQVSFGTFPIDGTDTLAALENLQASLKQFSYHSLSKENQLTYDILSSYISTAKVGASYTLYEEPLSSVTGIHAQLPVLLAEYALDTKADIETYLSLLEALPDYFASLVTFEAAKADAGLFMSDTALEEVLEQCNAFLSMGKSNYLLSTFQERIEKIDGLSQRWKASYIAQNEKLLHTAILPAYENLVASLSALKGKAKNEQGLCYLPGGKSYYQYLIARETGSSRSVHEILTLIDTQIADDILSMQTITKQNSDMTKGNASLIGTTPEQILSNLQQQIADAFPTAPKVSVKIKYVPKDLERHLSPAFYLIPAIDHSSENVIYINGGQSPDALQLFTTLAHEGYPGHLYQTTYYANTDPNPLRSIFNYKGYVEGWATYAEMCSYYLSELEKPYATLLQKNNSLILGLYARADLGIHYEGWDINRTEQFFQTFGITARNTIQEIFNLILADPGNYPAYYVGYLEILELKKAYIAQQGNAFSQKQFHKKLLEMGPAPFEIVNKFILQATH